MIKKYLIYTILLTFPFLTVARNLSAQEAVTVVPSPTPEQQKEKTLVESIEQVQINPEDEGPDFYQYTIFDDKQLLEGYANKYKNYSLEVVLSMIKDDNLNPYKTAAAVRVFRENLSDKLISPEKRVAEKILLRRLNKTTSPFVEVEIMFTLCTLDRYRYFKPVMPDLLQKLNHYNNSVNEIAFENLQPFLENGKKRSREARIVFNTLRRMMFISRKKLEKMTTADEKVSRQLKLLRWSIKVLGTEELKRLPAEVYNLL